MSGKIADLSCGPLRRVALVASIVWSATGLLGFVPTASADPLDASVIPAAQARRVYEGEFDEVLFQQEIRPGTPKVVVANVLRIRIVGRRATLRASFGYRYPISPGSACEITETRTFRDAGSVAGTTLRLDELVTRTQSEPNGACSLPGTDSTSDNPGVSVHQVDGDEISGRLAGLSFTASRSDGPTLEDFPSEVFRSKNVTIEHRLVDYAPKLAVVRHGTRVQLCNRDPIFHMPFIQIPGGSPVVSVTVAPGACEPFFEKLLAADGEFVRQLDGPAGSRAARKQVRSGFNRRTGRLLAPRREGKLGVCWRFFCAIHNEEKGAIYVLRRGQRKLSAKDVQAAEACFLAGAVR